MPPKKRVDNGDGEVEKKRRKKKTVQSDGAAESVGTVQETEGKVVSVLYFSTAPLPWSPGHSHWCGLFEPCIDNICSLTMANFRHGTNLCLTAGLDARNFYHKFTLEHGQCLKS